jgi:hypothetical protein
MREVAMPSHNSTAFLVLSGLLCLEQGEPSTVAPAPVTAAAVSSMVMMLQMVSNKGR